MPLPPFNRLLPHTWGQSRRNRAKGAPLAASAGTDDPLRPDDRAEAGTNPGQGAAGQDAAHSRGQTTGQQLLCQGQSWLAAPMPAARATPAKAPQGLGAAAFATDAAGGVPLPVDLRVLTINGPCRAGSLRVGDKVIGRDNGLVPLTRASASVSLLPAVRISAACLGLARPGRTLIMPANQWVVVQGWRLMLFGSPPNQRPARATARNLFRMRDQTGPTPLPQDLYQDGPLDRPHGLSLHLSGGASRVLAKTRSRVLPLSALVDGCSIVALGPRPMPVIRLATPQPRILYADGLELAVPGAPLAE